VTKVATRPSCACG